MRWEVNAGMPRRSIKERHRQRRKQKGQNANFFSYSSARLIRPQWRYPTRFLRTTPQCVRVFCPSRFYDCPLPGRGAVFVFFPFLNVYAYIHGFVF